MNDKEKGLTELKHHHRCVKDICGFAVLIKLQKEAPHLILIRINLRHETSKEENWPKVIVPLVKSWINCY